MAATQDNRNIAVETPLGKDVLLLQGFRLKEGLSRPFELTLDMQSEQPIREPQRLLGEKVTVRISLPDGKERYLNGYVRKFEKLSMNMDVFTYRAEVVPWFALLKLSSDSRIHQQKTVPEIIKEVFGELGFSDYRFSLTRAYSERPICTQYDESHFQFISRLMEMEGIAYFFEHQRGQHTLVLCDEPSDYNEFPGYGSVPFQPQQEGHPDIERVINWSTSIELESESITLNDYDYTTPRANLRATAKSPPTGLAAKGAWYQAPGYYDNHTEGELFARLRIEELNCRRHRFRGLARCAGFSAGHTFHLTGTPAKVEDAEYLITEVDLQIEAADFTTSGPIPFSYESRCELVAIPAQKQFRPPLITPKPRIDSIQTAVVTGPKGHDEKVPFVSPLGSVRVQFRWDRHGNYDDKSSGWIRVSQISAGEGWGSVFTPRIGCEVLVAFENGDPDRPTLVGNVYNFVNQPPLPLPGYAQRSYISDDGGNAIAFTPEDGNQSVVIYSPSKDSMHVIGASDDDGSNIPPPGVG